MSIMSLGKGTSGFSPVSTIGMSAFLISFSTNPEDTGVKARELQTTSKRKFSLKSRPDCGLKDEEEGKKIHTHSVCDPSLHIVALH